MFDLTDLEAACALVHKLLPPTPCYAWPLLAEAAGRPVWVKHENHTPTGAFKVRGGLVYLDWLRRERPEVGTILSATRGNHGQSLAFAAARHGVTAKILVPQGNSREKNAAMRAFGATLVVHGKDFDEAKTEARRLAEAGEGFLVPSFDPLLCLGVATYAFELLKVRPDLETVYVPIGLGSGICGLVRTCDLLGVRARIVGVVSESADAYARSFEAGRMIETQTADTFADGMAVRVPDPLALEIIRAGVDRVVRVSDDKIADAVRLYYQATHNLAEGAGAAPLAALLKENREGVAAGESAVILCGGNIDAGVFSAILQGQTPRSAIA
ncbi:MAG: threonine dehydratase [Geminicoccaceae bacterium]